MNVTFITTVFNEEKTINKLLESLLAQSRMPDEIIIVDGGSSDQTVEKIKDQRVKSKDYNGKFLVIVKPGNRSVGRNKAIKNSTGDIIVCSDAGCILDKYWIEEIVKPFKNNATDVVAGYYKGSSNNIFQKCLVPYVLVMPDKVNPDNFLPASRSMAFRKSVWEKSGGFPEEFSHNEDYVFARKLKNMNYSIAFCKQAFVYWIPRRNLREASYMFYRFSLGDAESKAFRPKVGIIFIRYILGILLLYFAIIRDSYVLSVTLALLVFFYFIWAIEKNYKYVKDLKAIIILPVLQIVSDLAVVLGTIIGIFKYGL
ncbi:MAG TPA: glycosyltransferase [Candidatus Limnocylindrales bacterium]|nr:glycosyltransferase [Candidatus Limnocylindrales bacterium]